MSPGLSLSQSQIEELRDRFSELRRALEQRQQRIKALEERVATLQGSNQDVAREPPRPREENPGEDEAADQRLDSQASTEDVASQAERSEPLEQEQVDRQATTNGSPEASPTQRLVVTQW